MSEKSGVILGFDFGLSQIGVATAQTITGTASALKILKAKTGAPDWSEIEVLLAEWRPSLLVVGLPLNMDGSESDMSRRARKFAGRLHGRFGLKVELMDERLSSFDVKQSIIESKISGTSGAKKMPLDKVDSEVAALILQSWLENQART